MKQVAGLGEALWDMLPEGKQIGGAPANFAYHAGLFGHKAYAVSAVGRDEAGEELKERLTAKGFSLHLPALDKPTGRVLVTLSQGGIPHYDICRDVAWDYIPFTPELEEIARHTQAACFGTLAQRHDVSRHTIHRFLRAMPQGEETLKVFDVNLRQHFYDTPMLDESLQLCNVVKLNDEELPVVTEAFGIGHETPETGCRMLMKRFGLRMVILTCGTKGSYVFSPEGTSYIETPRVEVADTVGAGDSFTGAFVGSLLNGKRIHEAHLTAVRHAAYVCTCHGAMPDAPHTLHQHTPLSSSTL